MPIRIVHDAVVVLHRSQTRRGDRVLFDKVCQSHVRSVLFYGWGLAFVSFLASAFTLLDLHCPACRTVHDKIDLVVVVVVLVVPIVLVVLVVVLVLVLVPVAGARAAAGGGAGGGARGGGGGGRRRAG